MDALLFGSLVKKVIDFIRLLTNWKTERSGILTQIIAWVAAIGLVWLASTSKITDGVVLPGSSIALAHLDGSGIVLAGLLVGSFGSSIADVLKSIDTSQSESKPPLIAPADPGV